MGLMELLIALMMLNIGILAIIAAFSSGSVAIKRASRVSTAAALADTQMELYRALAYNSIVLDSALVSSANSDATYRNDAANPLTWKPPATQVTATCTAPIPKQCTPLQTLTGADRGVYRVDTYIVTTTPSSGRQLKQITIVVRDSQTLLTYARETSTFDQSTG